MGLLHKEEKSSNKTKLRRREKETKVGNVLLFGFGHRRWGVSSLFADSLRVPASVSLILPPIELNRSVTQALLSPLVLSLSLRSVCLFLFFLSIPVSALSIALSCLMDEADRRRDSLSLSVTVG